MVAPSPPEDDATVPASRYGGSAAPSAAESLLNSPRLPLGTRLRNFEVTGYIGQGGFGIVYRAYDHRLEREVAIKEYMPTSLATRVGGTAIVPNSEESRDTFEVGLRSFVNEARLLAQFDHPNLVRVYDYWDENGTAYMVMPLYRGPTLRQAKQREAEPPTEAWLRELLRPLCDALTVIHAGQCVHRDISPDNILMLENGQPLLLDFGAARRVISDRTQLLTVILRPGYAPIEQYSETSDSRQGPWSDVYALAAVVYFLITGAAPKTAVGRMITDDLRRFGDVGAGRYSAPFLAGLDSALAVKPEERPRSIADFAEQLGVDTAPLRRPTSAGAIPASPVASRVESPAATPSPGVAPASAAGASSPVPAVAAPAPVPAVPASTSVPAVPVTTSAPAGRASMPAPDGPAVSAASAPDVPPATAAAAPRSRPFWSRDAPANARPASPATRPPDVPVSRSRAARMAPWVIGALALVTAAWWLGFGAREPEAPGAGQPATLSTTAPPTDGAPLTAPATTSKTDAPVIAPPTAASPTAPLPPDTRREPPAPPPIALPWSAEPPVPPPRAPRAATAPGSGTPEAGRQANAPEKPSKGSGDASAASTVGAGAPPAGPSSSTAVQPSIAAPKDTRTTGQSALPARKNSRCSDFLNRLQLGEVLSEQEQATFQKECRS